MKAKKARSSRTKQAIEKKKKQEETKIKERDMWKRLNELNSGFKEHKKTKKYVKKMSATITKH